MIVRTFNIATLGIAIGTAASLVVAHRIQSLLFGTTAGDPLTFVAMILLLLGVALLAGYIPALRASRIDPMVAMRSNWIFELNRDAEFLDCNCVSRIFQSPIGRMSVHVWFRDASSAPTTASLP